MPGANYWNQRYIKNEIGWDIGEASLPIITYINQLKQKNLKILVPGAGNAYEAGYLFTNGFSNVFLLDWAEKALENFKNRYPGFPVEQLICADFFKHTGSYDLIIEQTFFCAINPLFRKNYVHKMHELLNSGGKLAGLLFNKEFEKEGPPFGGTSAEYESLFQHHFEIKILEDCYNSIQPRAGSELFFKFVKNESINPNSVNFQDLGFNRNR